LDAFSGPSRLLVDQSVESGVRSTWFLDPVGDLIDIGGEPIRVWMLGGPPDGSGPALAPDQVPTT
jgi:hypothetical protein